MKEEVENTENKKNLKVEKLQEVGLDDLIF